MNSSTTQGIEISVRSQYLPEQSSPPDRRYFFVYEITITNKGSKQAQLLERHWIITDGFGNTEEVRGPGVVGQQPILDPGKSFTYNSFCPLNTPTGQMRGTYKMIDFDGQTFEAEIPMFLLIEPASFN